MAKVFWMGVGAGLALWGRRKTQQKVDRYVPPVVREKAARMGKAVVQDAVDAQRDARAYMSQRRKESAVPPIPPDHP